MRGRIFESKNMAHAGVDSATRACEPSASWVRAREALARGCDRRVLKAVLGAHVRIRMWRQGPRGRVFSGSGAHVWGRADYLPCLLYNMMSMDLVPVQTLVKVDSYALCATTRTGEKRSPRATFFRLCVGCGGRDVDQASTPAPHGVTWYGRWL